MQATTSIMKLPNGDLASPSADGLYRFTIELPEGLWEAYDLDEQKTYASAIVTGDEDILHDVTVEVLTSLPNGCVKLLVAGSIR